MALLPPMLLVVVVVVVVGLPVPILSLGEGDLAADTVKSLPDVGEMKTRTLAGFVLANRQYGGELFYVFMESQKRPMSEHTILWLNGGPGSSSMFGAFVENGPYVILGNGSWISNAWGWNLRFNMLWIDNPVGTGFAYVNNSRGYVHTLWTLTEDLFQALCGFFRAHPEYGGQKLWMFGESFAGHYLAALGSRLLKDSLPHGVQFAGLGFGNCWLDGLAQTPSNGAYLYRHKRISDAQLQQYNASMERYLYLIDERMYVEAFEYDTALFNQLCAWANVTDPFDWRYRVDPTEAPSLALERYFARADVKRALHVPLERNFSTGERAYRALDSDEERSVLFHMPALFERVPVLVYSGAYDVVCNWEGALAWVSNTIWSGQVEFLKAPTISLLLPNITAPVGWLRRARQLRFVTVANAGHMSPFDQPQAVTEVVSLFIQGKY